MNDLLLDPVLSTVRHSSPRCSHHTSSFPILPQTQARTQIAELKANILAEFRPDFEQDADLLELVIAEAEGLAWETGFPVLLFPELAAEMARQILAVLVARRSGVALLFAADCFRATRVLRSH